MTLVEWFDVSRIICLALVELGGVRLNGVCEYFFLVVLALLGLVNGYHSMGHLSAFQMAISSEGDVYCRWKESAHPGSISFR